jgi:hexosaminidase
MMLRRLAGTSEVRPLEVLAEAAEPLKGYERSNQGVVYSTLSPFGRFADACFPESLIARSFRVKVDRYLEKRDPALAAELGAALVRWRNNHPLVLPFLAASPALREVEPLSMTLQSAAGIGLEALGYLSAGRAPEKGWVDAERQALAEAGKPLAHAHLAVAAAVVKLVEACAPAK